MSEDKAIAAALDAARQWVAANPRVRVDADRDMIELITVAVRAALAVFIPSRPFKIIGRES